MFSGAIKIGDLNDFIAPSQACVVNIGLGKSDKVGPDDGEVGSSPLGMRLDRMHSPMLAAAKLLLALLTFQTHQHALSCALPNLFPAWPSTPG